jgi:hypothetical protein
MEYETWINEVKQHSRGGMFTFKGLPDELRNVTQLRIGTLRDEVRFVGQIDRNIAYVVNDKEDGNGRI